MQESSWTEVTEPPASERREFSNENLIDSIEAASAAGPPDLEQNQWENDLEGFPQADFGPNEIDIHNIQQVSEMR